MAKPSWGNTRTPKQEEAQVCLLEAVHVSISNLQHSGIFKSAYYSMVVLLINPKL